MQLFDSNQWVQDIDDVLSVLPELSDLEGKSILITGAAGLVCSSVVDILFRYNDIHNSKIRILAAGRWEDEMTARFGNMVNRPDFAFVSYDASKNDNEVFERADYIIHGASNASPNMIIQEPVETLMANVLGIKNLMDYAKQCEAKRILYISSSEVYGRFNDDKPHSEEEYGPIDFLNSRSSYSIGKCAAETLCVSYSDEYGIDSVIVRPGHVYGPTASQHDVRVGSAWAYAASKGEPIVMKSDGSQTRSYVYTLDCASAMLKVLFSGKTRHAYNISNPNSIISIKELGEILANIGNVQLVVDSPTGIETKRFNQMKNSSLDSEKLMNLGWRGFFNAKDGLEHTVRILKEINQ